MAVKTLLLLNDPAYGTERSYNGLRLAGALAKRDDSEVRVFLIGDAVTCAMAGQKVPDGYYHLDRMIESAARHGAELGCCGTCMDARGIHRRPPHQGRPPFDPRRTRRLDLLGRQGRHLLTEEFLP